MAFSPHSEGRKVVISYISSLDILKLLSLLSEQTDPFQIGLSRSCFREDPLEAGEMFCSASSYTMPLVSTIPQHVVAVAAVLFVLLLSREDVEVLGQRRSWRRHNLKQPGAPGPNMCKVQHVMGKKDKFYTYCVAKHLKYICERPTYVRWDCCSGYTRKGRERGCTNALPLDNLYNLTKDLELHRFNHHARKARLVEDLSRHGPFTVFAPTDEAFAKLALNDLSNLHDENSPPSQVHYHIAPGRLQVSDFRKKNQEFVTLHQGDKIRVNKYAFGVATVNCARIIKPDELATNGILHVIDKVISPVDVHDTIAQRLHDDERFSQFEMALLLSDLAKKLRKERHSFTVLAPTNEAFSKLPQHIFDKIFSDANTAEKILRRHIIRGVFCADAIVVAVGLKTMDQDRLLFRCKREGLWINQARVVHPDIVTSNGVIHGVDTVLLPDSVKSMPDLMREMHLGGFLALMEQTGLNDSFPAKNFTVFTPTNDAISKLDPEYLARLQKNPEAMKKVVQHHIVPGKVKKSDLVGDSDLASIADVGIKITVQRSGVTVDKAMVGEHPRECEEAVIHKVDNVLLPPESTLVDTVFDMSDLSVFSEFLMASEVAEALLPHGSYTLLAPTDKAFSYLNQGQLHAIRDDPDRLRKFVERHVITRMVLKCSVPPSGVYILTSMQKDETYFANDRRNRLHINKHARVISEDLLTSNGILYKIDHVLPCSCEPLLRTRWGHYISDNRYRKPYS
ncbi:transforming growth factor-beta-induced protein ig-h3-like [Plakobranchus ocellatus]|uniref:Transforming growth factor-beta-induced protein ig-h3-like n=1 Tax=Plakobranchus ocellatus TaxID=259542 RepID=A0AAV3YE96_9GAST|nr:transforming growth factor-beta-induced protein ig-h3-like [Plakobranchus ocellatus]